MRKIPSAERRAALPRTSEGEWERRYDGRIDSAVDDAAKRGAFDHLAGRGRPLDLHAEEGLATHGDDWLENHLLRNAGYTPPWVRTGQALERAKARSAALEAAWRAGDSDRAALESSLSLAWAAENALTRRWNDQVPGPALQRYPTPPARRWERLRAAPAGEGAGSER
jgi:hypothetical protein